METEYKKYHEECNNPKSYYDWATDYKAKTIESLKEQLKKWKEFEPKKSVVIKVKKQNMEK